MCPLEQWPAGTPTEQNGAAALPAGATTILSYRPVNPPPTCNFGKTPHGCAESPRDIIYNAIPTNSMSVWNRREAVVDALRREG
jgi:hypothetical protein